MLPAKAVSGLALILFSRLGDGLLPLRVVDGVGIELGLQTHGAAGLVMGAVLAVATGKVGGVDLHTGAIGVDGHTPATVGIGKGGTGVAEHLEIVVIAILQVQGLIIFPNVPAQGLGLAEVHRSTLHIPQLAGGNALGIGDRKEPSGHRKDLLHGLGGLFVAGQVEVAVVGHIEHGVPVGNGLIADFQTVAGQPVGHPDVCIAGETLIQVRGVEGEADAILAVVHHLPQPALEAVGATVQVVNAVVGLQCVGLITHHNGGVLNPVGVSAHGSTQVGIAGSIGGRGVKTQHHIGPVALAVRHQQLHQGSAKIGDHGPHLAAGEGI